MNVAAVIFLAFFAFAATDEEFIYKPFGDEDMTDVIQADIEDDQIWRIPQFDGTFQMMTEGEAKELTLATEIVGRIKNHPHFQNKRRKVRFFLYTQKNVMKWQEIDMDRPETLHRSNFNSIHPTR